MLISSMAFEAQSRVNIDDRFLHAGASTLIGSGMVAATQNKKLSYTVCAIAGGAKELIDEIDYNGASMKDLIFDAFGCILGIELTSSYMGMKLAPSMSSDNIGVNMTYSF